MSRALQDIVVVDLTTEFWASLAASMLGDFGARVIRVEDLSATPRDPDRDGHHPPEAAFDAEAELIHRNKQSIALDLSHPDDQTILKQLVGRADVFLTDWPFAAIEERGWGYEDLIAEKPNLIYARGSGFGPEGPDRDLPALDELAAARTGVMPSLPEPDQPPVFAASGQMYTMVMLALGIVTALYHRDETGEGQIVDASLLGGNMYAATLTLDAFMAMRDDRLGEPRPRFGAANPMSGISYPSADGRWVTLTMPDTDRWWPAFSAIVGLEVDDERFDSHEKRCGESRLEMMQVLEELFAKHPASHWRAEFDAKKLSADIIEKYDYPARDPQAKVNRYVLDLDHPSYGSFQSLGFPIHMSDTPARLRAMAPCRGQHTAEVLDELLGWSDARILEREQKEGGAGGEAA
ncbi:MAG: CoA transferase [Deltaproteobacteria bacterium]|jgi:formyl-CoA transferase|nr:CoA transferase [Deltaproteobacteria bacterium]